jgi:hypothetical protein
MLVLDENLPASQRLLLRNCRIRFRVIGEGISFSGATDENLIPALHQLPPSTFFTLDSDFYRPDWAHKRYCLVWLNVRALEAAEYIRRFLREPKFDTQAKRAGKVVRAHPQGLVYWHCGHGSALSSHWKH